MSGIKIYGGIEEIGGNKIFVETDDGTVILDFGRRMGYTQNYFSEFLQIRSNNALRDMIRLGILPKINGVYFPNFLDASKIFEDDEDIDKVPMEQAPDYWKLEGVVPCDQDSPAIDAVFISHAHFDHLQDISFIDPKIQVYCTPKTKCLAKAISEVSQSGVDDQYYQLGKQKKIRQKSESYKTLCPCELECKEISETPKPIITDEKTNFGFTQECTPRYRSFITNSEGQIRSIGYKMIPVGHSVPGACSILLTLPDGKRVLYTGDLRFHGTNETTMDEYIAAINGSVDVMIMEGTRIGSSEVLKEADIANRIKFEIGTAEGLVLINFGWKDLTRFQSIYDAVRANNRIFVISPKLAYLLFEMHHNFPTEYADPRSMPNLKVYLKREGSLLYSKSDYDKFKMGYLHFHGRNVAKNDRNLVRIAERLGIGGDPTNTSNPLPNSSDEEPYDFQEIYELAMNHLDNGIRSYQIREKPKDYVLMFSFWDANELFDLIPLDSTDHNTKYISASTEPFNEEMEIDETKFINWLDFFNVQYDWEWKNEDEDLKIFVRQHVSGHASKPELKELLERINPAKIIPIHFDSKNKSHFQELGGDKIHFPNYGQLIEI